MITREQLEAMADAELDRVVAEVVMGWMVSREYAHKAWSVPLESPLFRKWDGEYIEKGDGSGLNCPAFSRDISAAWQVVAQIDSLGFNWVIENWMGKTLVRFSSRKPHPKDWSRFTAHTDGCAVARPICIAAVLAAQSAKEST